VVDVIAFIANIPWIVGLAGLLAVASFAEGERGRVNVSLYPSPTLFRTRLVQLASLFMLSVNTGILAATLHRSPFTLSMTVALAAVSAALSINLVISTLRSPRSAVKESAIPGRLTQ